MPGEKKAEERRLRRSWNADTSTRLSPSAADLERRVYHRYQITISKNPTTLQTTVLVSNWTKDRCISSNQGAFVENLF